MKLANIGLVTILASTSAHAYPLDIENHARWVVLDGMPETATGAQWDVEVTSLRTRDFAAGTISIAAVCGTLDSKNSDDGITNFVAYYSTNEEGQMVPVGRPYFFGAASNDYSDRQRVAAQMACSIAEERPLVEASR